MASASIASSSLSWLPSSPTTSFKGSFSKGLFGRQRWYLQQPNLMKGKLVQVQCGTVDAKRKFPKWQICGLADTECHSTNNEVTSDASEQHKQRHDIQVPSSERQLPLHFEGTIGKPGFISFYGRSEKEILELPQRKNHSNLIWFIGPSVLVASFIVPSLYLRRILSSIFEDSLLTDFLILFFTEALFYCGVGTFLVLIDHSRRPLALTWSAKSGVTQTTQLIHRISSVAVLVLSLTIPMVTMGLVWPWTGPAASATLAPYLVGIVMQFAFEQYARYVKSTSWPAIPVIFQVYRLHQLNRAAQLVTALSFTVRGAEATSHNMAINSSLGTLLNVLQFLGIICVWSVASFLMRFFSSASSLE